MFGRRRLLLALVCVFCCVAFGPAVASAAGTGSVAGTVTEAGGGAIDGAQVCAQERDGGEGGGCVGADPTGEYAIEELPEGEYEVTFNGEACVAGNCVREWGEQVFDGKYPGEEPTWVEVEEGNRTPDIDAELEAFGAISGTIAEAGGGPIAGTIVCFDVAPERGLFLNGCTRTDSAGNYEFTELPPAEYNIEFNGWVCEAGVDCTREECEMEQSCTHPYVAQYYLEDPIFDPENLQTVTVTSRSTTPGVDAELVIGGRIEGTVTLAGLGAQPLAGISVCSSNEKQTVESRCTTTDAHGDYTLEGLASSDSWLVKFSETCTEEPCPDIYVPQLWNGKPDEEEKGDEIALTAPAVVTGIDAAMVETTPQAPAFTANPELSGTPAVGATLNCSTGTWSHSAATLAYSWQRNGAAIAGQAADSYTVTGDDEGASLTCTVTVGNSGGSASATSNALSIPPASKSTETPSSPPGEAPKTTTAPGTANATGATTANSTVTVTLKCPSGQGPCKGSLKLVYKQKTKNSKGKTTVKNVAVSAPTPFTVQPGQTKKAKVKLNSKGKALLTEAGKQGLKVKLTGSGVTQRDLTVRSASGS